MATTNFKITVWQEDKYFVAQCLNVDISSFGKTRNEVIQNLEEALDLYLEDELEVKITKVIRPTIKTLSLKHA